MAGYSLLPRARCKNAHPKNDPLSTSSTLVAPAQGIGREGGICKKIRARPRRGSMCTLLGSFTLLIVFPDRPSPAFSPDARRTPSPPSPHASPHSAPHSPDTTSATARAESASHTASPPSL